MPVQIDFWQLLGGIAAVVAAFAAVTWAFGNVLVKQFKDGLDERFSAQDEMRKQREKSLDARFVALEQSIRQEGEGWRQVERELLQLKAALPLDYQRREDTIRQEVVIHAKLDALAAKIDALRAGG